tara:strand:+ start:15946 stop:16284 length:339 start_codon:yes stop_codon:yes gene_type:complete
MAFKGENALQMWANIKTTGTMEIRDSFNVSSITNVGGNTARLDLTTSFANTNYCVVCSCTEDDHSNSSRTPRNANPTRKRFVTGSVFVNAARYEEGNSSAVDQLLVACFGDQ